MNPTLAAPQAYRESAVMTASPERLVVMLYDGARRFLYQAAAAIRAGNVQATHDRLGRAEAIIDHLLSTLDMDQGGEVAQRLESIYLFSRRYLTEARLDRDPAKLDRVRELLGELRGSWDQLANANAGS